MGIAAGTIFAGYRIERKLGAGGMGEVYLAQHPRLPRKDAVKVLAAAHSGGADYCARFLREADLAAGLQHPNLVAIRDRGEEDGRLWIAMQYVPGTDLAELIRRAAVALKPARAVHILSETAEGLDEIHRAGLLHRDVKPANLLIAQEDGRPERVLVTDFGIARPADDTSTLMEGGFVGTLAYAAPERFEDGPVDHRADIYALGCTLFQMLTGTLPFIRNSTAALVYAHLAEQPPRPSAVNPAVPAGFDAVVAKAMAKRPEDRYASCGELAAAARAVGAGRTVREMLTVPAGTTRFVRSRRGIIAALVITALAVVIGVTVVGIGGSDTPTQAHARANPPRTGTIEPAQWGSYAYIAQTFPDLLPPEPYGAGYQELSVCNPIDGSDGSDGLFASPVPVASLLCIGNSDPAYTVIVTCNADRSPIAPQEPLGQAEGDEQWSRATGSGHLFWATAQNPGEDVAPGGGQAGLLDITFDQPNRSYCRLQVWGKTATGAELRARWWPEAPL